MCPESTRLIAFPNSGIAPLFRQTQKQITRSLNHTLLFSDNRVKLYYSSGHQHLYNNAVHEKERT